MPASAAPVLLDTEFMDALSRKRPSSATDAGPSQLKKRALTSHNGLPSRASPNALEDSETEPQTESLERFRKDAIFRRMRQHEREKERAETRIADLEQAKRSLEGAIGAIENCWNQVLDQMQIITEVDSLQLPQPTHVKDLFSLVEMHEPTDSPSQAFRRALVQDGVKTQNLVAAFMRMTEPRPSLPLQEIQRKCVDAAMEATSLRSEVHVMHAGLVDAQAELERYKILLSAAEKRIERAQLEARLTAESRASEMAQEIAKSLQMSNSTSEAKVKIEDASEVKTNGVHPDHLDDETDLLRGSVKRLEHEVNRLTQSKLQMQAQLVELQIKISSSGEELIAEHPTYSALLEFVGILKGRIEQAEEDAFEKSKRFEEDLRKVEQDAALEKTQLQNELAMFKTHYEHKDREVVKVKDQRDSALRDSALAKSAEMNKFHDRDAAAARSKSLDERVEGLVLEVKRLKAKLAADAGHADVLSFILGGGESTMFVEELQSKLKIAQSKVSAMEATTALFDANHADMHSLIRSEVAARQDSLNLREELAKYEKIFSIPSDVRILAERLKESDSKIDLLLLQQKQESAASTDLFDELQRMSSAWEILDKQSKSKIEDSNAWEAKYSRMSVEKAKAEQKYFATMREKETIEAERKASNRNIQQQNLLLNKLASAQKDFEARANDSEVRFRGSQEKLEVQDRMIQALEAETILLKTSKEQSDKQTSSYKSALESANAETERVRQESRKFEDELERTKQKAERDVTRLAKLSTTAGGSASSPRIVELQGEVTQLMTLLRCSTCNQQLRTHLLVKCLHTFCKDCIDARLSTRQRKCPACNQKFQDSDVQPLFFQ